MIIIFSSNDNFEILYNCLKQEFKLTALVTEPPKPKGRGLKVLPNDAHRFAFSKGITTLSPSRLDKKAIRTIKDHISDEKVILGISSAYGKIIPREIIDLFKFGIINIHPSLLPKYRGPSPIATPILNRDNESGYSIMKIDEGCDTGDLIAQSKIEIKINDSQKDLKKRIFAKICHDLPDIVNKYISGETAPLKQDHDKATYTKKIKKVDAKILNTDSIDKALGKILAYDEWPKAYFTIDNKRIIIHKAHKIQNKLAIDLIQLEGKRVMTFSDFKNGYAKLLTELPDFVSI